jgi:tetratricopeptide (TPR) repeat protein
MTEHTTSKRKARKTTPPVPDVSPVDSQAAPEPETADPHTPVLLQDWTPLGQCLDLRVSRTWWARHAPDLFTDHRVPTLAHDSGALSQRSARVLFAWCQEQQAAGTLPAEIVVVELGMGTGLHLRYLLDAFRDLCLGGHVDWYGRLIALGTDVSAATVRKALDRSLFVGHEGHVRLGYMDVQQPGLFLEFGSGRELDLRGQIHVLVANYVLDLLPVDVFRRSRREDGTFQWEAVLVRTWLQHPELLASYSDLTAADIVALTGSTEAQADEQLAAVFSLMQLELRAWPVDLSDHPDLDALVREAEAQEAALGQGHPLLAQGTVVNHSAGALRAALLVAQALSPHGYATLRDVGYTTPELAGEARTYQRYGPTGAAGVNLVQMDRFFASGRGPEGTRLHAPHHDGVRHQGARLLSRPGLPATLAEFEVAFDGEDLQRAGRLADEARDEPDATLAMEKFRQAVVLEPTNWHLLAEAARKALDGAGRADVALALAHRGLEINTEYSPELWNVYGDALHAQGELAAAAHAYTQGLIVGPRHPRLHYCAAWVDAERGRFDSAFRHLGEALACDPEGVLRGEVLQLLDACLRGQSRAWQDEAARLAGRNGG